MLKRKAFRKIIITTFSLITIFTISIVPNNFFSKDNYLNPNTETIYVTSIGSNEIYLLAKNNYLTKTSIILNEENLETKIRNIIDYLTINKSSKIPNGLSGIIPKDTTLNDVKINEGIAYLDFSNDLLNTNINNERKIIEAITYSLVNINGIEGVIIKQDNKVITELPQTKEKLPKVLNRNFGINKVYELKEIKDTSIVTMYYINEIDNEYYYVPVTKYLNDDRDKIKIIIDNLASNYVYEPSLLSLIPQNTQLINYEIDNDTMTINLSNNILLDDNILEEVVYQITNSVFENYDVEKINIQIKGEKIIETSKCCGITSKNS